MAKRTRPTAVETIDSLWRSHYSARSLFPRMDPQLADSGLREWSPPGFYDESPYQRVVMKQPITSSDVEFNNDVAHWMNENFIIRLYAILQTYQVAKVDQPDAPGYDAYKIVRRLRDKLAHGSSGRYDASDSLDRDALARLNRVCRELVEPQDYDGRFDLSISGVLFPLLLGCREYAAAILGLPRPIVPLEPTPPGWDWTS